MNYEETKKLIARAEELAQAVNDGKSVMTDNHPKDMPVSHKSASDFFALIRNGHKFLIAQPKTRRPWTQKEAEEHLGWVLVSPNGWRQMFVTMLDQHRIWWIPGLDPSLETLRSEGWQVHPIGQPDNLKPAYVEE